MVLKILSWSKGYSGIRLKLASHLVNMFNKDILPLIPSLGSVRPPAALAPLPHVPFAITGVSNILPNE